MGMKVQHKECNQQFCNNFLWWQQVCYLGWVFNIVYNDWITMLYIWNQYNTIHQVYFNKNIFLKDSMDIYWTHSNHWKFVYFQFINPREKDEKLHSGSYKLQTKISQLSLGWYLITDWRQGSFTVLVLNSWKSFRYNFPSSQEIVTGIKEKFLLFNTIN